MNDNTSVDPASWEPGTLIVNPDGSDVCELDTVAHVGRWATLIDLSTGNETDLTFEELIESWRPLADVVARGWEQRQEVGVDYCLVHDGIRNEDEHQCDFAQHDGECDENGDPSACRLAPLSYPIPEGNNE